ncbi:2,4-diketo-3-deoxy-L-fuconate hydrolase [Nitrobacteraceae bacterium AZCC 2146]
MKIVRFGPAGGERPGVLLDDGSIADVSSLVSDILPGNEELEELLVSEVDALSALPKAPTGVRLGCPTAGIGKIVGVGLNYREHAKESNAPIPKEPIIFLKANTSLCGPYDDVILPRRSVKTDWEVELAIVIGRRASYVTAERALEHVFGYAICNDVSEREHQIERGGQWTKGKSHDTFCPIGPWLVTKAEVPDPQALRLWCDVSGTRRQDSTTSDMIFTVAQCISYISEFMTLLPGDVITTGTPQGVGLGLRPQQYLSAGDTMRLGIDGLGEQSQNVKPPRPA